jgi:pyruvate/2-oxoglutarate dehydrogenase complex dihydrolipoamide dehydrogenase (E3) component
MAQHPYDLLILGAGAAGSAAASAAAGERRRVALVERHLLGGTCLNYGCDPTKTLLHTAKALTQARQAGRFGLHIPTAEVEWGQVLSQVQRALTQMRGGTLPEVVAQLKEQGIEVLLGEARFLSTDELEVGEQRVRAKRVLIATGCAPTIPPVEGLGEVGYLTNMEAVALPVLPRRLAVVGGGPIGLEFAQMFRRFGVEVTVLERGPHLLEKEDPELADHLSKLLAEEGLRLETNAELRRVQRANGCKRLTIRCGEREEETLEVDEILLALGRCPALEELHLEAAGVQASEKGVQVDATLRTNVPTIWAAGDVLGGYQFTHLATRRANMSPTMPLPNAPAL